MLRHAPHIWHGAVRGIGTGILISALVIPAQMADAATHLLDDPERLLSTDGFGECVPEESLDEIWLVLSKGGKSSRIPHVCMHGDCADMPDIRAWASAQQFPDDIDLDREDVQAQYGAFVAEFCEAANEDAVPEVDLSVPEEPEVGPGPVDDAVPPVLLEAPPPAPLGPLGTPGLFSPRQFNNTPAPFMPPMAPLVSFGGPGGGGFTTFSDPDTPPPPLVPESPPGPTPPGPTDPTDPELPPSVVPLPAPLLLLMSALGLLGLLRRRVRS
ncbi:hypothetical protein [Rhodobaculum claviforme]|uniref:hypothetical protein n=1 Tax=Rhodobaculum claviforme TaxID=1549854 RepID=UPI001A90FB8E|nr:hypothetical protein [Rhodobaculum claviforme]